MDKNQTTTETETNAKAEANPTEVTSVDALPTNVLSKEPTLPPVVAPKQQKSFRGTTLRGGRKGGGGGRRGGRSSHERARPEFEHKIINVRRVTRVVAGGRRFSFSVALVAGDRKGSVGVGIGKGGDTALAIEKAMRSAKKNMIKLRLTKEMSIPHDVKEKFSSARILMTPARGRGIIAGSSVRNVLHLAGVKDVSAKILSGSKNKLNIARAAVQALSSFGEAKKNIKEVQKTWDTIVTPKVAETQGTKN